MEQNEMHDEHFKQLQREIIEESNRAYREKEAKEDRKNKAAIWLTLSAIACFIGVVSLSYGTKFSWLTDLIAAVVIYFIARTIYNGINN